MKVLLTAAFIACTSVLSAAENLVIAWNQVALDAIRFANAPPPAAARQLAILHLAMFDAVNGLGGPFVNYRAHTNRPPNASAPAAVAAAANLVLRLAYPQFTATFDASLQAQLIGLPDGSAKASGLAWGRQVAQELVLERDFDGASLGIDYRPTARPGFWQPTPPLFATALLPQWPGVRPFALERGDQFRPPPPPELTSAAWASDLKEVKELGARTSPRRTAEQTEIAWFWADGVGTQTPPGHWNDVAAQLAVARGLSLIDSARLFALLNLALADAGIVAWDAKYAYDYWRPITAIRYAETDNNPTTQPDLTWTPLVVTPPFPEYVSGHSTFSSAAATLLSEFSGGDEFSFNLTSDGLFGVTRSWLSFSEAAQEAGQSRIYGGIHFQAANREGQKAGRAIGQYVARHFLLPADAVRLTNFLENQVLILRWPLGLHLESCSQLSAFNWILESARGELRIPADAPQRFFRLVAPSPPLAAPSKNAAPLQNSDDWMTAGAPR